MLEARRSLLRTAQEAGRHSRRRPAQEAARGAPEEKEDADAGPPGGGGAGDAGALASEEAAPPRSRGWRVAEPVDKLRGCSDQAGVNDQDVFVPEVARRVRDTASQAAVVFVGVECKTFSRAREIPSAAARHSQPLRSEERPLGLAGLGPRQAEALRRGNALADFAFDLAEDAISRGDIFVLENPARSLLWATPRGEALRRRPDVKLWVGHSCMFGGERRKPTGFLSNAADLSAVERRCEVARGGGCARTGRPHAPWTPFVDEGRQVRFPTAQEAEYPEELCRVMVDALAEEVHKRAAKSRYDFFEVFSGPNAPMSRAAAARTAPAAPAGAPRGRTRDGALVARARLPRATQGFTEKEVRAEENEACAGGLRSPWRACERLPRLRAVGRQLRSVLDGFLNAHPRFLELATAGEAAAELAKDSSLDELRAAVVSACGGGHDIAAAPHSPWRPGIVAAHIRASGDPETELVDWLTGGAPIGVRREIRPCGVFPRTAEAPPTEDKVDDILTDVHVGHNYRSFEEVRHLAVPELERIVQAGYACVVGSWKDVVAKYGQAVVSKLACLVKERKDGTTKIRLVVDLRRSSVNRFVVCGERVVLPRLRDALAGAVHLLRRRQEARGGGEARGGEAYEEAPEEEDPGVSAMVADFKDAFHTLPVHPAEEPFGIAKADGDRYVCFKTIMFGGVASPLVWGRAAAYLLRGAQALFRADEVVCECYVDDPLVLAAGTEKQRRRLHALFLLWILVFGPNVSWAKVDRGPRVSWCGAEVVIASRTCAKVVLGEQFVQELLAETEEQLRRPLAPLGTVSRIAGRATWAMGLVPVLRSFIDSLWVAVTELRARARGGIAGGKRLKTLPGNEPAIETSRIRTSLLWLRAFLRRRIGTGELGRSVDVETYYGREKVRITTDASPWGLGGTLEVSGRVMAFFADRVTQADVDALGVAVGESRSQAVLETLALAVAVREWLPEWGKERTVVEVRSDSVAALGAVVAGGSGKPVINKIVREIALDVAMSRYGVDFASHLPGKENVLSDQLSRLHEPGGARHIPAALRSVRQTVPRERGASWWEAAGGPEAFGEAAHEEEPTSPQAGSSAAGARDGPQVAPGGPAAAAPQQ